MSLLFATRGPGVLSELPDERAVAILRHCRSAMRATGRLFPASRRRRVAVALVYQYMG